MFKRLMYNFCWYVMLHYILLLFLRYHLCKRFVVNLSLCSTNDSLLFIRFISWQFTCLLGDHLVIPHFMYKNINEQSFTLYSSQPSSRGWLSSTWLKPGTESLRRVLSSLGQQGHPGLWTLRFSSDRADGDGLKDRFGLDFKAFKIIQDLALL